MVSEEPCEVQPCRLVSPVLARFPWYSTTISTSDDLSNIGDEAFQNFVKSLKGYESSLFNHSSGNELAFKIQSTLGIGISGEVVPWQRQSNDLNTNDCSRLCSVIGAYRLVDVVAMLNDAHPAPSVERCFFQVPNSSFRGMDKMANWPHVLEQFRTTIAKSQKTAQFSSMPQDRCGPFSLLRLIARNHTTRQYNAIEANFLYAAMHIACMKELHFQNEVCPDLPDNLDILLHGQTFSVEEQADLNDLHSLFEELTTAQRPTDSVSYMRAPLHLALLISPIFLLLPIQLFKKSYNRHTMLSISTCLGNSKPRLLLDVEKQIWKTLFCLASGKIDPFDLLHQLSDTLPWKDIHDPLSDSRWFNLSTLPASPRHENISLQSPASIEPLDASTPDIPLTSHFEHFNYDPPLPSSSCAPLIFQAACSTTALDPPASLPDENLSLQASAACESSATTSNIPQTASFASTLASAINRATDISSSHADPVLSTTTAQDLPITVELNWEPMVPSESMDANQDSSGFGARRDELQDATGSSPVDGDPMDTDLDGEDVEQPGPVDARATRVRRVPPKQTVVDSDGKSEPSRSATSDNTSSFTRRPRKRPRLSTTSDRHAVQADLLPESAKGTQEDPIDVDLHLSLWEPRMLSDFVEDQEPTFLKSEDSVPRFKCDTEMRGFDANGGEHRFTPECHFDARVAQLKPFFNHIEADYIDGKPRHIADPKTSCFDIISFIDFQRLSTSQIQDRLRHKHVVVTGYPHPNTKFDEAGLRALSPLGRKISIQDHSLRGPTGLTPITVTGQTKDLLENATPHGKILNALDFPMWKDSQWDRSPYATDMVAWDYLHGNPHCGTATVPYPTGHVRWGLAGTAHAVSMFHIDSDGFATFVQVMDGAKLWAVYRPSPTLPLSDINVFLRPEFFHLDKIPLKAKFRMEAVVLRPGDLLLMRPGVPHFVYGLENAIVHGGHFYCSSLIQPTLQSLIHSFVLSDFITNTFHHPSRQLLRRIVVFWGLALLENRLTPADNEYFHLPNVRTVQGLLDLISGCTLAILGNVLDFRTYCGPNQAEQHPTTNEQLQLWKQFDRNNIPGDERMSMCYARGIAMELFRWIRMWCIVETPDGDIIDDLPSKHMVALLNTLSDYKSKAEARKLKGAPHCALWKLKAQVLNVVKCDRSVEKLWNEMNGKSEGSLGLTLDEGCTIRWKDDAPGAIIRQTSFYEQNGLTDFDHKFLHGERHRSRLEADIL